MVVKSNLDRRLKLTRSIENKIVIMLRSWNSKITWDLLIERIKNELGLNITKPTLRKFNKINFEFYRAKGRYKSISKLPVSTIKIISENDVRYYEKYIECLAEKKVIQEIIDEQYALIERMLKNAEEIPSLDINDLVRDRAEDW